ncbi:MAG: MFS transporter [Chloroflexi bacterium]|nr:MFS transporter [Chloroflexota bacterium]MBU1747372.1 MFS transporter [Chloroflexota bacterium]MBU1879593.1 MFS transporter [Chloroflexota bacterium]
MKLDYPKTFLLGFGFLGVSIIWSVYNSFIPPFLRDYALPWWLVGFVMTFDNIAGIIIQPYIGQLSDCTRTRFGRRMPYLMVSAPIAAVFFILIPIVYQNLPHTGTALLILSAVIIVMNIAMAIFRTPTVALMPDITAPVNRSKANGIINLMGGVGTALAFLGGAALFRLNPGLPFYAAALIMLGAVGIVLLVIRERKDYCSTEGQPAGERPGPVATFAKTLRDAARVFTAPEKSAMFIFLAILTWFIGYNAIETFWTSYGREVLYAPQIAAGTMTPDEAVAKAAGMLVFIALSFLVMALPAGFIASWFGRKRTILTGLAIMILLWVGVFFIKNDIYIIVALVLSGVAWALVNVNSLPVVVDLVPESEVGSYTGLYYFFSMAAAIIAPPLAGLLMDFVDVTLMPLFAPVFMALAFLCVLGVRRSEPPETVPAEV